MVCRACWDLPSYRWWPGAGTPSPAQGLTCRRLPFLQRGFVGAAPEETSSGEDVSRQLTALDDLPGAGWACQHLDAGEKCRLRATPPA